MRASCSLILQFYNTFHKKILAIALYKRASLQGIIEGNQIQVAAFSLEYFSYLTGLTLGQWERKPNSVVRF